MNHGGVASERRKRFETSRVFYFAETAPVLAACMAPRNPTKAIEHNPLLVHTGTLSVACLWECAEYMPLTLRDVNSISQRQSGVVLAQSALRETGAGIFLEGHKVLS